MHASMTVSGVCLIQINSTQLLHTVQKKTDTSPSAYINHILNNYVHLKIIINNISIVTPIDSKHTCGDNRKKEGQWNWGKKHKTVHRVRVSETTKRPHNSVYWTLLITEMNRPLYSNSLPNATLQLCPVRRWCQSFKQRSAHLWQLSHHLQICHVKPNGRGLTHR